MIQCMLNINNIGKIFIIIIVCVWHHRSSASESVHFKINHSQWLILSLCMMHHKLEFVLISLVIQPWRNFSSNLKTTTTCTFTCSIKLFCTDFQIVNHADSFFIFTMGKGALGSVFQNVAKMLMNFLRYSFPIRSHLSLDISHKYRENDYS